MDWLNYHHLYYFWIVAREGSIAAATKKLHLAQPTISAQIRLLERSLGVKLFMKRGRNLALTESGQAVLRYAEDIFSLGKELSQTVRGERGDRPQRFAVGISDSLPKLTTFKILEPVFQLNPTLRVLVRIGKTESLLGELATHALDMVLSDSPVVPTLPIRAFNHLIYECGASVFGTEALAKKYRSLFPRSLHEAPLILQTPNTALRRSVDLWMHEQQISPSIVAEVEDMAMLQVMGQHGLGLFVAPTLVENEVCRQHHVKVIGRLDGVRERFYALSVERRIRHPAVIAISEAANSEK